MAKAPRGWSVRSRLLIIALLPMLILMPLLIGITMQRWLWRTDQILAARVASDLTVAQQYLAHLIDSTGRQVAAFGQSAEFRDHAADDISDFLAANRRELGLDYLLLLDASGRPLTPADAQPTLPVGTGITLLDASTLTALSPQLAERARIPLIATPASAPDGREAETRGMVIHTTSPVSLPDGDTALLAGGVLLNNNTGFTDRINELVYPTADSNMQRAVAGGFDHGVTTLFLDDTRIATTLRPSGDTRAIGTRASAEVRDQVLIQGGSWHDTAFVVSEWYISAYEAIADMNGARVGMLYTGIPKAPYAAARKVTWAITGGAFLAAVLLALPLFLHWARGIFRPLEAMGRTISRVELGDMNARTLTAPPPGPDEILRLARHLDRLLDLLQQRDRDLRGLNANLNKRVEERTADLTRVNTALEAATRQLVLSEKLATIGEVTAGVAHEINNPLAVIQGNLEVVGMVLADHGGNAATELALIDEQIRRIGALVNQLLQFARPEEFDHGPDTDPAQVAQGLRPLVQHLLNGIELQTNIHSTRHVRMNIHELQQILVNLAVNAIQAMPHGGTIFLSCKDARSEDGRDGVALTLRDTGTGMDKATLARIFDPFFTTRGTSGTGLGLSICQTLVNRHAGKMFAQSTPGQGTAFSVWLPAESPA
ncbi:cache domain-containing protein [Paracoccus methylovorus]|uniref:histidine kinase n=3 Tax=Paracoccus TaxID=265 RepID=A0ABX7JQY5_9RHOB|nr:cache domain-containing protein [Paracoccus methylovorus]